MWVLVSVCLFDLCSKLVKRFGLLKQAWVTCNGAILGENPCHESLITEYSTLSIMGKLFLLSLQGVIAFSLTQVRRGIWCRVCQENKRIIQHTPKFSEAKPKRHKNQNHVDRIMLVSWEFSSRIFNTIGVSYSSGAIRAIPVSLA